MVKLELQTKITMEKIWEGLSTDTSMFSTLLSQVDPITYGILRFRQLHGGLVQTQEARLWLTD